MNSLTNTVGRFSSTLSRSILLRNENPISAQYFQIAKANYNNVAYLKYVASNIVMSSLMTYKKINNSIKGKKPRPQKEHPKDTVILYQFPRASYTPSMSPFAMKLETWLRAADINYKNQFGMQRGRKGLIPFIKLNGEQVDDSQSCIEYLNNIYEVDLDSYLTAEQRAISHLVNKLCDDSLLWCGVASQRFIRNPNGAKDNDFPLIGYWNFQYRVGKVLNIIGYGRHSDDELFHRVKKDLNAIETLIGGKKYLFSNEKPCVADFSFFGISSQMLYNDNYIVNKFIKAECPNIVKHNQTIKEAYWPDWDDQIRKPKKPTLKDTN